LPARFGPVGAQRAIGKQRGVELPPGGSQIIARCPLSDIGSQISGLENLPVVQPHLDRITCFFALADADFEIGKRLNRCGRGSLTSRGSTGLAGCTARLITHYRTLFMNE